jgi:hypothetical protein
MPKRFSLASMLVVLVAVASSIASPRGQAQSCVGTNIAASIVIASGAIRHVPDIPVTVKGHCIDWTIKTSDYKFPVSPQPDGIAFKAPTLNNDNGQMPAGEFDCKRRSDVLYRCQNKNSKHGTGDLNYEYSVTVVDTKGNLISTPDPWVINK